MLKEGEENQENKFGRRWEWWGGRKEGRTGRQKRKKSETSLNTFHMPGILYTFPHLDFLTGLLFFSLGPVQSILHMMLFMQITCIWLFSVSYCQKNKVQSLNMVSKVLNLFFSWLASGWAPSLSAYTPSPATLNYLCYFLSYYWACVCCSLCLEILPHRPLFLHNRPNL